MFNLFIVSDIVDTGFLDIVLDILSLFSILFGIYVINSKNPIMSVFFLIGLFLSISLNLILLGFNFIGLSYLLVYVGAVSILFLFILMLINVRISELVNDTNNSIPLAIFTCFSFAFPIYQVLIISNPLKNKLIDFDLNSFFYFENAKQAIDGIKESSKTFGYDKELLDNDILHELYDNYLYFVVSNKWDNNIVQYSDISSIGNIMYTVYGVWLIVSSIILLLAMIGAINITKKEKD